MLIIHIPTPKLANWVSIVDYEKNSVTLFCKLCLYKLVLRKLDSETIQPFPDLHKFYIQLMRVAQSFMWLSQSHR